MTTRDLGNIHATRNICRDTLACTSIHFQNYPTAVFLPADGEAFCLLLPSSVRPHNATRKRLFLYPQVDWSGLKKSKKVKSQLPPAFISPSQSKLI